MELWESMLKDGLTPTRLWLRLDPKVRHEAAEALYAHDWQDEPVKSDANSAIASALRFREQAVRKLPTAERVKYLARTVRPDTTLVSSLLLSLHLENRKELMADFLGTLDIPHEDGLIDETYDVEAPVPEKLRKAVDKALESHEEPHVELYLLTLYMMDLKTWGGLIEVMKERVAG